MIPDNGEAQRENIMISLQVSTQDNRLMRCKNLNMTISQFHTQYSNVLKLSKTMLRFHQITPQHRTNVSGSQITKNGHRDQ